MMTHTEFLENLTAWSQTDKGIVPEGTHPNAVHAWEYGQKEVPPDQRPKWRLTVGNELRCGNCCPITYLLKKETGREVDVGDWEQAAAELGIEGYLDIVNAADCIPRYDTALRHKLLVACGLGKEA